MPGPGEYVSDGTHWRPAVVQIRMGSTTKNDEVRPPAILDPQTGKPLEHLDPAAVESIKKDLGRNIDDPMIPADIKIEVAKYEADKEKADLAATINKLADVVTMLTDGRPGEVPGLLGPDQPPPKK